MLRYRVVDYYTGKTIGEQLFDDYEDAKDFQRRYHRSAVENKIAVHNWLTFVEEVESLDVEDEHGEDCHCVECETCMHCGGTVGEDSCEHC